MPIECSEIRKLWLSTDCDKRVRQFSEDTIWRAMVDVRIKPVDVTQRLLETIRPGFKNELLVLALREGQRGS